MIDIIKYIFGISRVNRDEKDEIFIDLNSFTSERNCEWFKHP